MNYYMDHEEYQYIQLIRDILEKGNEELSRNGKVLSLFGYSMRFSLTGGIIPLLTTKRVAWKTCFNELKWFIRGSTNNDELNDVNVKIWDMNSTREFLDGRGLHLNRVGDLGPVYGHQWRHFNAPYETCDSDYHGKGVDQLGDIIKTLKDPTQRSSRRLVMSAWNPEQLNEMALPPCHVMVQFNVRGGKYLSCALYQRSGDVGLGVPFNIASYSFLTHILARHCDLMADEFVYFLGNAHIYEDHIEPLRKQIQMVPYEFPKLTIREKYEDIEQYSLDDIEWDSKYIHHGTIKMNMVT
jgi:thymidylate synthase